MSTQTMAGRRTDQIADAITDMAQRYGEAERNRAYAFDASLRPCAEDLRAARWSDLNYWERACHRRFKAVQRLTAVLRDLPLRVE